MGSKDTSNPWRQLVSYCRPCHLPCSIITMPKSLNTENTKKQAKNKN